MFVDFAIFATALAALITAIVNWQSASRLSRTIEAQLFLDFSQRYNSEDMLKAITNLVDFYRRNPDDFVSRWHDIRGERGQEWSEIRQSRRLVVRYFVDIQRLYEGGYFSKRFVVLLINHPGLNVFYDIAVPAMRPNTDLEGVAERLKQVMPRHGKGLYT